LGLRVSRLSEEQFRSPQCPSSGTMSGNGGFSYMPKVCDEDSGDYLFRSSQSGNGGFSLCLAIQIQKQVLIGFDPLNRGSLSRVLSGMGALAITDGFMAMRDAKKFRSPQCPNSGTISGNGGCRQMKTSIWEITSQCLDPLNAQIQARYRGMGAVSQAEFCARLKQAVS
jgi:hypothetical protein